MMRLIRRVLVWLSASFADPILRLQLESCETELKMLAVKLEAAELERDSLASVVERDRRRVAAETAEFSMKAFRNGGST